MIAARLGRSCGEEQATRPSEWKCPLPCRARANNAHRGIARPGHRHMPVLKRRRSCPRRAIAGPTSRAKFWPDQQEPRAPKAGRQRATQNKSVNVALRQRSAWKHASFGPQNGATQETARKLGKFPGPRVHAGPPEFRQARSKLPSVSRTGCPSGHPFVPLGRAFKGRSTNGREDVR